MLNPPGVLARFKTIRQLYDSLTPCQTVLATYIYQHTIERRKAGVLSEVVYDFVRKREEAGPSYF